MKEIIKKKIMSDWETIGQVQAPRTLALSPIEIKGYNVKEIKDIFKFWIDFVWYTPTWEYIESFEDFIFWLENIYSYRQTKFKWLWENGTFLTNKNDSLEFMEYAKRYLDKNTVVYDLFCWLGSLWVPLSQDWYNVKFVDKNETFTEMLAYGWYNSRNENILWWYVNQAWTRFEFYEETAKQIIANPPFGAWFDFEVFSKLIDLLESEWVMILILPNNFYEKHRNIKKFNPLFDKIKLLDEFKVDFNFTATKVKTSIFVFEKL